MVFKKLKQKMMANRDKMYVIYRNDKPNLIVNKELLGILFSDNWSLQIDDHQLDGVAKCHGWHIAEDNQVYITYTGEWSSTLIKYNSDYYKSKTKRVLKALSELNDNKNSGTCEDEKVLIKIKCHINNIQSIKAYKHKNKENNVLKNAETELKF